MNTTDLEKGLAHADVSNTSRRIARRSRTLPTLLTRVTGGTEKLNAEAQWLFLRVRMLPRSSSVYANFSRLPIMSA